jgi:NADPH:quinone reductase-like Zn-dependent oxidoreductase
MSYNRVKFDQYGDPATVLSFETVQGIPTPSDDEIVIQVTASPIDPYDLIVIRGEPCRLDQTTFLTYLIVGVHIAYGPANPNPPASPGCEGKLATTTFSGNFDTLTGVGHVRSIGKNVTQLAVGQRVAFFSHTGTIAANLSTRDVLTIRRCLGGIRGAQKALRPRHSCSRQSSRFRRWSTYGQSLHCLRTY